MAQVNWCLKRVFLTYTVVFGIFGGIVIILAMLFQVITSDETAAQMKDWTTWVIFLYVVGASTILIALMGAYAGYKENRAFLMEFMVLMTCIALLMVYLGPKDSLVQQIEEGLDDKFRELLPLNTADPKIKQMLVKLQTQLHCCGLFSYSDWNNQFPDSCRCLQSEEDQCIRVDNLKTASFSYGTVSVYSKPCFPSFKYYLLISVKIILGFHFTLVSLALLGGVQAFIMTRQLREPDSTTAPVSDPATDPAPDDV